MLTTTGVPAQRRDPLLEGVGAAVEQLVRLLADGGQRRRGARPAPSPSSGESSEPGCRRPRPTRRRRRASEAQRASASEDGRGARRESCDVHTRLGLAVCSSIRALIAYGPFEFLDPGGGPERSRSSRGTLDQAVPPPRAVLRRRGAPDQKASWLRPAKLPRERRRRPSSADIERAARVRPRALPARRREARRPSRPGTARRRALDAALAEIDAGPEAPSIEWRRDFSLLLGLERLLAEEPPKLRDGAELNPHQVDALSGTLAELIAEQQSSRNGNAQRRPAAAAPAEAGRGAGERPTPRADNGEADGRRSRRGRSSRPTRSRRTGRTRPSEDEERRRGGARGPRRRAAASGSSTRPAPARPSPRSASSRPRAPAAS